MSNSKFGSKIKTMIITFSKVTMSPKIFAIDTESVGVGSNNTSALARVSIVDAKGEKVFDAYCKPWKPVSHNNQ